MADLEEREVLRKELMAIPELSISSSMYNNLEVNAKGADKAPLFYGLQTILALTGKKPCHLETGKMISL